MVRFKHRYLLINLIFPQSLSNPLSSSQVLTQVPPGLVTEGGITTLLRESLAVNFGDIGAGEVGGSFNVKYLSTHTNVVIIRVSRDHYRTLWAALTLLRRLGGQEVIAQVIHASGTMRKIQHAAIAYDRKGILEAAAKGKTLDLSNQEEAEKKMKESEEIIMRLEA